MTHEPVSRPFNLSDGVRSSSRAPARPLTVAEAARRMKVASGVEDEYAAIVELVNALVREPSVDGAIGLARMAEVARHSGFGELATWIDKQVDRVELESQRTLVAETMRFAAEQVVKQTIEDFTREVGEGRMREIRAAISKRESMGGKK